MTRHRSFAGWLLLQLVVLAAVICGAEIALRLAGYGDAPKSRLSLLTITETDSGAVAEPKYVHLARPDIGESIPLPDGNKFLVIGPMRPFRAVLPRPENTYRVVVMGSSPAYGLEGSLSAADRVRARLPEFAPQPETEVIDLTNRHMTLEMLHLLVPDVARLQPQLALVFLSAAWPTLAPPPATDEAAGRGWRGFLRGSVLIRALWDWFAPAPAHAQENNRIYLPKPQEYPDKYLAGRVSVAKITNKTMRRAREEQILALAGELTEAGITTVLVGSFADLVQFRPLLSLHREPLPADRLAQFVDHYSQACTVADAGHCAAAVPEFERALKIDPGFANLHFRLALCYREMGREEAAAEAFFAAQRTDLSPERAALAPGQDPAPGVRALGAVYLDPYELMLRQLGRRMPDSSWFQDLSHLSDQGQTVLVDLVMTELPTIFAHQ
jgi:Tetratricopeptide repeat